MNSPAAKSSLSREHHERITAIREKAQRHIQHSARLFSPPPEETDNNLLPVPSLLAVACTAALANQAQGQEAVVSNFDEFNNALQNPNITDIKINEFTYDIFLAPTDHFQPINKKGINLNGETGPVGHSQESSLYFKGNAGLFFLEDTGEIGYLEFNESYGDEPSSPGGAIYSKKGVGDIFRSGFYGNTAINGGAISAHNFNSTISQSRFRDNKAKEYNNSEGHGGALYFINFNGKKDSDFFENSAASEGGAAYLGSSNEQLNKDGTIIKSVFDKNSAGEKGGAIYADSSFYNPIFWEDRICRMGVYRIIFL